MHCHIQSQSMFGAMAAAYMCRWIMVIFDRLTAENFRKSMLHQAISLPRSTLWPLRAR